MVCLPASAPEGIICSLEYSFTPCLCSFLQAPLLYLPCRQFVVLDPCSSKSESFLEFMLPYLLSQLEFPRLFDLSLLKICFPRTYSKGRRFCCVWVGRFLLYFFPVIGVESQIHICSKKECPPLCCCLCSSSLSPPLLPNCIPIVFFN